MRRASLLAGLLFYHSRVARVSAHLALHAPRPRHGLLHPLQSPPPTPSSLASSSARTRVPRGPRAVRAAAGTLVHASAARARAPCLGSSCRMSASSTPPPSPSPSLPRRLHAACSEPPCCPGTLLPPGRTPCAFLGRRRRPRRGAGVQRGRNDNPKPGGHAGSSNSPQRRHVHAAARLSTGTETRAPGRPPSGSGRGFRASRGAQQRLLAKGWTGGRRGGGQAEEANMWHELRQGTRTSCC